MLHQHKRSQSSKSDEWWTPKDLFWELVDKYKFLPMLDVCATEANSLRNLFFSKKDNALTRKWIKGRKKRKTWCNPPAKEQGKFIAKAYEQFKKHGIQTMMIVPLNVQSSKPYENCVQLPMERGERIFSRPIYRRRAFLHRGRKTGTSINGYCIIIFGRRMKFGIRT